MSNSFFKGWQNVLPTIQLGGSSTDSRELFMGQVLDVYYDDKTPTKVRVRVLGFSRELNDDDVTLEALPINYNTLKVPLPGELVALIQSQYIDNEERTSSLSYYYFDCLTTNQSIGYNGNPYLGLMIPTKKASNYFTPAYQTRFDQKFQCLTGYKSEIDGSIKTKSRLKPFEGDLIIQGRFGAAIRFSSSSGKKENTPWSNSKEVPGDMPGNPMIVMSANDLTTDSGVENVNADDSSVYVCTSQQISIEMSTSQLSSLKRVFGIEKKLDVIQKDPAVFLETIFQQLDGGGFGYEASTAAVDSMGSRTPWNAAAYRPGTLASLPQEYSHTEAQGYNLLNNKWIGDLITSAKSHIRTPTFDVPGTEKGNLGCASAVSIIFYRAFGVNMLTGKPVKAIPRDIGDFGSKGTSTLGGGFGNNPQLWQKFPWTEAQPGDIMNTQRLSDKVAGHIGIVIDTISQDGSFNIISNSSAGFAGGGGGAVKQNYTVKAWQKVTNRNPTKTFAWRYIGPKL